MAQDYPGTWKQCATCAFWLGRRDCDYFGQRVSVFSSTESGRCAIPYGGPWKNSQKTAGSSCSSWQKWPVLK